MVVLLRFVSVDIDGDSGDAADAAVVAVVAVVDAVDFAVLGVVAPLLLFFLLLFSLSLSSCCWH